MMWYFPICCSLWLARPLIQDVLSFHLMLWQPGATVCTTGLLPCDPLLFHCWSLFELHSLPLTGVSWSGRDSLYTVLEGRFSQAVLAHLPVTVSLKHLILLMKGEP